MGRNAIVFLPNSEYWRCGTAESASTAAAAPSFDSKGDFYTQEEMAQFQKPKTKKVRFLAEPAVEKVPPKH